MAEKRSPTVSDDSSTKTVVNFGAFPFPLTDGPDESPYLKWVRNHSNYMAVRGFLDYLRIVAVLVRGIVVNFLIFLPYLLIAAVGYGYAHHWMLEHPFYLTLAVLAIVIAWILFFPTLMKLIGVISYRRSLEVGSESSIKQRDVYERSFGGLLMVILAVALLESLPWILEYLHDLVQEEKIGWKGGLATVAAALALLSGSDKLLSALSGAKKKVAMVLIGILGLLVPLLVILYATDFLVYGPPPSPALMFSPLAVPVLGVLAIAIAIPLGLSCRAFTTKECAGLLGLLLAGLVLVWGVVKGADSATDQRKVAYEDVRQITAPIAQVAAAIGKISNKTEMIPEVATLVDEIAAAEREYAIMKDDVKRDVEQLRTDNIRPRGETWSDSLQRLYDVWNAYTKPAAWEAGYFLAGQQFVTLGDELSAQPRGSLEPLRRELAKLAYGRLLQEHREKADSLLQEHREKADSLLQEHRERVDSEQMAVELLRNKLVELVGLPEISVYEDFVAETSNEPEEEKDDRRRESVKELQRRSVEELAILAGENQLADMVDEKFKKLPGKAELARLAGKEELAKLARTDEMISLVLTGTTKQRDSDKTTLLTAPYKNSIKEFLSDKRRQAGGDQGPPGPAASAKFFVDFIEKLLSEKRVGQAGDDLGLAGPAAAGKISGDVTTPTAQGKIVFSDDSAGPNLVNVPVDLVIEVAREELVKKTLEGFNVKQLGIVAKDPGFYENEFSASDPALEGFDRRTFGELKKIAQELPLSKLLTYAFKDPTKGPTKSEETETEIQTKSYPGMYKMLFARKVLASPPADASKPSTEETAHLDKLAELARSILVEKALSDSETLSETKDAREELGKVIYGLDSTRESASVSLLTIDELARIAVARFDPKTSGILADKLIATLVFGEYGALDRAGPVGTKDGGGLENIKRKLSETVMLPKVIFVLQLAVVIMLGSWFTVDVNMTSIHGLYRDRLASAFLVGQDTQGDVGVEEDINLHDICHYEARSTAPYHLVNVALNLQGSRDIDIRDRNSDFFIFSKRFIGGDRTGYCRSETMGQVFPQMNLASAMAVSAAAASPNMGRGTSPLLVAFMTLLNIRLGYWMPNPGRLEERQYGNRWRRRKEQVKAPHGPTMKPLGFNFEEVFTQELEEIERRWDQVDPDCSQRHRDKKTNQPTTRHGLVGIGYSGGGIRSAAINLGITQALHNAGVFGHVDYMSTVSGGGYLGSGISSLMRSRTKLVSEIAGTVEVKTEKIFSEIEGTVSIDETDNEQVVVVTPSAEGKKEEAKRYPFSLATKLAVKDKDVIKPGDLLILHHGREGQELTGAESGDGSLTESRKRNIGDQVVTVSPSEPGEEQRIYRFSRDAMLNVEDKQNISKGRPLIKPSTVTSVSDLTGTVNVERKGEEQIVKIQETHGDEQREYQFSRFERLVVETGDTIQAGQALIQRQNSLGDRFRWRVRPSALLREITSRLDEKHRWINLSDGGHLENLAAMELLRRRCKYIIVGDGEADPNLHFAGLATLMRSAYIDLGIKIDINLDEIRLKEADKEKVSGDHRAIGRITYPKEGDNEDKYGYLLYLKSSYTGDEEEAIREYRHRNPTFPHQTTANQFFDEGQFEAYRALGQHIAEQALKVPGGEPSPDKPMSFDQLEKWFKDLWESRNKPKRRAAAPRRNRKKPTAYA